MDKEIEGMADSACALRRNENHGLGSSGDGQYRLAGDISMPGTWTLVLSASVPGEASPVEGSTRFVAARERSDP